MEFNKFKESMLVFKHGSIKMREIPKFPKLNVNIRIEGGLDKFGIITIRTLHSLLGNKRLTFKKMGIVNKFIICCRIILQPSWTDWNLPLKTQQKKLGLEHLRMGHQWTISKRKLYIKSTNLKRCFISGLKFHCGVIVKH
mgnify:CR=1 FL=1